MKRPLLAAFFALAFAPTVWAQNELSNFTATGRGGVANTFVNEYQSIGINPANLGRPNSAIFAFSIGEIGAGINSKSMTRKQLKKFVTATDEKLTPAQKQEFAAAFNNQDALNLNVDFTGLAVSASLPGIGGIAFNNRQRIATHVGLNKNGADILFLGKDAPIFASYKEGDSINIRETLAPTAIQMSFLNEWNVAVGFSVLDQPGFKLQAGAGYRYIQGVGVLDVVVDNDKIVAYTALSPKFDVNYGDLVNNPSFNTADIGSGLFEPVGEGHGFDFGLAAEFNNKVKAGIAVTDLGNMTWRGHLLTAQNEYFQIVESEGINSFNIFKEVASIAGGEADGLFTYEPNKELKKKLPTKLRMGAGIKLSKKVETGVDVTLPLNEVAGNLITPFAGAGIDYLPVPQLRLSSGFSTGAGYGKCIPLGVTFVTPNYEFGIATRDIIGVLTEENPYLSAAFGFLRFRFGLSDESAR
ncbi:MAG TPA: DUF5723 family protein [Adhaeribacter sp.]|nr:DUF5723 family protein [Adhaeribacter sp.]